ncbi:MAG: 6-bladed beta-propeller [Cyclobacteriaceae bacterium]
MKQRTIIILFFFILFINSCEIEKDKNSQTLSSQENVSNIQINQEQIIDEALPVEAHIKAIIPLETNNESIINNYFKLAFNRDKILILDAMNIMSASRKGQVLMFDTLGNFIQAVGRNGKGPKEYLTPMNLQVGPRGEIHIYCNAKSSILSYDSNGNFLTTIKLPYKTPYFAKLSNGDVMFEYLHKNSDFKIGKYKQSKDTIEYYLPLSNQIKDAMFYTSINPELGFTLFNGHYYFCPQKSNQIYKLVDGIPIVQYNLDIAGFEYYLPPHPKNLSSKENNKIFEIQKLKKYKSKGKDQLEAITYLQSNMYDKINFFFNWGGPLYTILREKESGRIIVGSITQSEPRNNLVDISNLLLFYAKSTTSDGEFVAALKTEDFKNLAKIYLELPENKLNRLCFNPKKLNEIANSRDAWSNHVLVVFSLENV